LPTGAIVAHPQKKHPIERAVGAEDSKALQGRHDSVPDKIAQSIDLDMKLVREYLKSSHKQTHYSHEASSSWKSDFQAFAS
jgi:hypothetical protein